MWKVIRRGLIANKVRFALTGIAVILGVAFISGTLVLTSTISKSFDDLFATIDQGTDAVVRAHVVISGGFGSGDLVTTSASVGAPYERWNVIAGGDGDLTVYARCVTFTA